MFPNKPTIEVIRSIEKAKEVTKEVARKTQHLDPEILNKLQVTNKVKMGLVKEVEHKKRVTLMQE